MFRKKSLPERRNHSNTLLHYGKYKIAEVKIKTAWDKNWLVIWIMNTWCTFYQYYSLRPHYSSPNVCLVWHNLLKEAFMQIIECIIKKQERLLTFLKTPTTLKATRKTAQTEGEHNRVLCSLTQNRNKPVEPVWRQSVWEKKRKWRIIWSRNSTVTLFVPVMNINLRWSNHNWSAETQLPNKTASVLWLLVTGFHLAGHWLHTLPFKSFGINKIFFFLSKSN